MGEPASGTGLTVVTGGSRGSAPPRADSWPRPVTTWWVKQAELDVGARSDGLSSDERAELAQLRRENRRLREDVKILKRATAFFATETR